MNEQHVWAEHREPSSAETDEWDHRGRSESIFLLSFNRRQLLASVWGTSHHTAGRRKTKLPRLQGRNIDAPVPLRDRRARPQIMQIAFVSECSQEHQGDIWRDVNNNKLETVFDQNKSGLCAGLNGSLCYSNRFINHNWNFSRTWSTSGFTMDTGGQLTVPGLYFIIKQLTLMLMFTDVFLD